MAATINLHLREQWAELRRGRPGRRFQERYQRARRGRKTPGGTRILFVGMAIVALAIGAVLAVFPGPAIPFFFVAGGLLASESLTIARFMDWSEVRVRAILAWGKRIWRRLSLPARIITVILFACCSAAFAFFSFRFLKGGN